MDIKWFPFDDQGCQLKFGSWTYDGTKIDLKIKDGATEASLSGYSKSGEWDLLGMFHVVVCFVLCCAVFMLLGGDCRIFHVACSSELSRGYIT